MQDPGVHYPPAIVDRDVVGRYLSHGVPLAGSNVRVKAFEYTRCGVLQTPRRSAELLEPRDRGVEVRLVEYLAAVDRSPSTVKMAIPRHSASNPSCEVHVPHG